MVDTPRTTAALNTTLFQDGQAAGSITPQDMRDFVVSTFDIVPSVISAAGTTQGNATVLTAQFNIVTVCAAGAGVMATAGYTKIWNATANSCLVYPISSAQFNTSGVNASVFIAAGGSAEFAMTSTTQGYAR